MHTKQKSQINSLIQRSKWPLIIGIVIIALGFSGYSMLIFGGGLIVDEEQFILDQTTVIESSDGNIVGKLYNENRVYIPLDEIPEHVQQAFISIEDARFYQHSGIDIKAVFRAIYRDLIAFSKVEGASTITQQLAKNLFLSQDKTWMRKTKEVMAAIYLERDYSKKEILELYLNAIYFGHGMYGIETAADHFFSKPVQELTITEGALLAGLVKAPNYYSPIRHPERALERRNIVLQGMEKQGALNTHERLEAQGKTLGLDVEEKEVNPAIDSYLDLVMKEAAEKYQLTIGELRRGGYRIVAHMDEEKQQIVYENFQKDGYFPGSVDGVEASFVMMDQESGKIVAALGGRNYELGNLNRLTVKRQPGSTFKPLAVYAPALMTDEYEPYTLISDQQEDFDGYSVVNADGHYEGSISLFEAIKQSKNTSAVWLLDQIGISYSKGYLNQLQMPLIDEGLSIALGGLAEGVTPLDLVAGYRTFAHEGKYIKPYTIEKIYNSQGEEIGKSTLDEEEVFSPQLAWDMTKILKETVKSGTAAFGEYPKELAGKTGSTEHPHVPGMYKDAWFVGYTPEYVSALWIGYDYSDADHYLTGGSAYPTTLTKQILTEMDQADTFVSTFIKPDHIVDLPDPIHLEQVRDVSVKYTFGGFSLVKGKINWQPLADERIVYRIYEKRADGDHLLGEVEGENSFVIDKISLFQTHSYYIIPYDPLTKIEGEPSTVVNLSL